jgi:hypothetical protein
VGDKSEKIAEFGYVQQTVSISVGHLKFSLNEVQQLMLAHRAFVALAGALTRVFGHVGSSNDSYPAHHLKKLSNPGSGPFNSFFLRLPLRSALVPNMRSAYREGQIS